MQHKRHFLIYLSKESGAVAPFPTVHPLFYTSAQALSTRNDRINITNVRLFALLWPYVCLSMAAIYYCGLVLINRRGLELHLIRSRLADTFKHNPLHLLRVRLPQIA